MEKLLKSVNSLKIEITALLDIVPDVHTLTLGPLNVTFQSKRDFTDVVRLSLEMGNYPGVSGLLRCAHNSPYKGEAKGPSSEKRGWDRSRGWSHVLSKGGWPPAKDAWLLEAGRQDRCRPGPSRGTARPSDVQPLELLTINVLCNVLPRQQELLITHVNINNVFYRKKTIFSKNISENKSSDVYFFCNSNFWLNGRQLASGICFRDQCVGM